MKRRDFCAGSTSLAVAGTLLTPRMLLAQTKLPQEGVDFIKLDKPALVSAAVGQVEVIEFFWYNCPHCNAFEPVLAQWVAKLPQDVAFKRVPIAFRDDFVPQQRLFYALEALGLTARLHAKVFDAIHTQKLNLSTGEAIVDWVSKQGVDKARFVEQFDSFASFTQASQAKQLQTVYQVEGVPAMGVAGRFYTDGALAKNMDRVLQVVEILVDQVRHESARASQKKSTEKKPPSVKKPVEKKS